MGGRARISGTELREQIPETSENHCVGLEFEHRLAWEGVQGSKETYRDLEAACGVSHSFPDAEGDFSVADAFALLPGDTSD